MNKANLFKNLPDEDLNHILALCDRHTYDNVVKILRFPRDEGGLSIKTSISALCRFYHHYHTENVGHAVMCQYGKSLQIRREQNPGATLAGILALVECGLLHQLKVGRPVSDLTEDFKNLARIHKAYVTDEKLRVLHGHDESQKTSRQYIAEQAEAPDVDFTDISVSSNPPAALHPHETAPKSDQNALPTLQEQRDQALAKTEHLPPIDIGSVDSTAPDVAVPPPLTPAKGNGPTRTTPHPSTHPISTPAPSNPPVFPPFPLFSIVPEGAGTGSWDPVASARKVADALVAKSRFATPGSPSTPQPCAHVDDRARKLQLQTA